MSGPNKRDEREKEAAAQKPPAPPKEPPKKEPAPSVGGAIDAIKERKKMLDEI